MGLKLHTAVPTALIATTIGAVTVLGLYLYQKKRKEALPKEWQPIGKVKGLYVYPLKSGRRIELKTAQCTVEGIVADNQLRDRCLVVYKEGNNEFKTARTHPNIVLIDVTSTRPQHFTIKAPGMQTLEVDVSKISVDDHGAITMFQGEKVFTADCGSEAAEWVSQYLLGSAIGLRLGFHDGLSSHKRRVKNVYGPYQKVYPELEDEAMGIYSDMSSYLVMNQSSVDELRSRTNDSSITVNNFRPSILIDGENISPYAEDEWDWLKIGDVILRKVKPCARCMLTTINPETGQRSATHEPLKTLKTYRKVKELTNVDVEGNDPIMGNYMKLRHPGQINVGDAVLLGRN